MVDSIVRHQFNCSRFGVVGSARFPVAELTVAAKKSPKVDPHTGYVSLSDVDIEIAGCVSAKLPLMGIKPDRVVDKTQHLLRHIIGKGEVEHWESMFVSPVVLRSVFGNLAQLHRDNTRDWIGASVQRQKRSPEDLNGVVFARSCVADTPPEEKLEGSALKKGATSTRVELSFHVSREIGNRKKVVVFRFSEHEEGSSVLAGND